MAVYRSKGIVLRSIRYGEADRILDLYTREAGLVSAIAKGIRRTRSRFGARLEPLSCVDFVAYHGRTLDTITQAEVLRSFHGVRGDLARLEAAAGMARAVRALSGEEADRRAFNLLYNGLDALEGRALGFAVLEASFGLKLSILAGYAPQLDACLGCEVDLHGAAEPLHFAPNLGGVLCADCRRTATGDSFPISPATLGRLRALVEGPIREAPARGGEGVLRVVRSHILAHAPGNPLPRGGSQRQPA